MRESASIEPPVNRFSAFCVQRPGRTKGHAANGLGPVVTLSSANSRGPARNGTRHGR